VQLGLERHRGVGIIGFNSPEWFISDLGAIFAGYVFAAEFIAVTFGTKEVSLEILTTAIFMVMRISEFTEDSTTSV